MSTKYRQIASFTNGHTYLIVEENKIDLTKKQIKDMMVEIINLFIETMHKNKTNKDK